MAKTLFERTERENTKNLKGQAALVMEALDNADGPADVPALTEVIKELGLITRQDPERITAYYLSIFKKQGLVRTVQVEDKDEAAVEDEAAADSDEVELATAE
jgi:hypothetical protein